MALKPNLAPAAHPGLPLAQSWTLIEVPVALGIVLITALYLYAVGPLRRRYGWAERVERRQVVYFILAMAILFGSLQGPMHVLSDTYLLTAHMLQHMFITLVVPPLLLKSLPGWLVDRVLLFPLYVRRILRTQWPGRITGSLPRGPFLLRAGRLVTSATVAFTVFNAVLLLWHIPAFYEATLTDDTVHSAMHSMFLGNAMQIEVTTPETGATWLAHTPYYVFQKSGQQVTHPDIQSGWWSDLYLAPSQYLPAKQAAPGVLQMMKEQPQQIDGYTLIFQRFELPNREAMLRGEGPMAVKAVVDVFAPDGTVATVRPAFRVEADGSTVSEPLTLPGGATAALTRVDPASGVAVIQLGGIDLSTINPDDIKARAFVEVSVEPGINLVWAGIIIGVLGGLLAMIRRWREARPAADRVTEPRPTPTSTPGRRTLQPHTASIASLESEAHR